jgi:crossover junction endodeoxyribonuclease RuvC
VVILGIDPGIANTGFGVVRRTGGRVVALDGGVIETSSTEAAEQRLAILHEQVGALLDRHAPDAIALEALYFGQNARSAFAVGQARGVILLAAGQRGCPCADYTPQQVKAAVCGSGRAPKDQVIRMVQALLALPEPPAPDHAADALAVAICHANRAPLAAASARAALVVGA